MFSRYEGGKCHYAVKSVLWNTSNRFILYKWNKLNICKTKFQKKKNVFLQGGTCITNLPNLVFPMFFLPRRKKRWGKQGPLRRRVRAKNWIFRPYYLLRGDLTVIPAPGDSWCHQRQVAETSCFQVPMKILAICKMLVRSSLCRGQSRSVQKDSSGRLGSKHLTEDLAACDWSIVVGMIPQSFPAKFHQCPGQANRNHIFKKWEGVVGLQYWCRTVN